mmetsp:Transcript_6365/g.7224  ORF Transcript_6365/g.7224 Transcript_6365/m.7224 type:complete len:194 (+) Transcript_6365:71-652(+)|eukprot:Skav223869  [mRNA]  locus=scaffold1226:200619:201200:- [translate_table: standard]
MAAIAAGCFAGFACGAATVWGMSRQTSNRPKTPVKTPEKGPLQVETADQKRVAKCNCGQLQVTITGPDPERISLCHCLLCQKQSGNIFAVQARFPKEQVMIEGTSTSWKIPKDQADQLEYRNCVSLGGGGCFHFCPQCGSTVWYTADADLLRVGVKVGCLTDPTFPAPKLSGFEDYMHPWALDTASLRIQHIK